MWSKVILLSILPALLSAATIPAIITPVDTFNCQVRSWTRAPDLQPNLISLAESRLVLNGSDCKEFVKWEVGLKMNERSLVKLSKDKVDLPKAPTYNDTEEMKYWNQFDSQNNNIFEIGQRRNYGMNSPYQLARAEYMKVISKHSLWQIHGRERKVFDEKILLLEAQGNDSLPLESVQQFIVAVPNTNFPPSVQNEFFQSSWDDSQSEFTAVESELSYYFSLTLRNGSVFEYLAGRTVFLPVTSPGSELKKEVTKSTSLERRRGYCNAFDELSDSKCPKADNTSSFEVDVVFPDASLHFTQGDQVYLQTTIRSIGPITEIPSYISFFANTRTNYTYAGKYGRTLEEKARLENQGNGRNNDFSTMPGQSKIQLKTIKVKSQAEEVEEELKNRNGHHFFGGFDERLVGGTALNSTERDQTVLVNFTIPHDILPSFNLTFKEFVSYLQIQLHTISTNSSRVSSVASVEKLTEDEKWSDQPPFHRFISAIVKDDFIHKGNMSIIIDSAVTSTSTPLHYTNALASNPTLLKASSGLLDSLQSQTTFVVFPKLSTSLLVESEEESVEMQKYGRDKHRNKKNWYYSQRDGSKSLSGQIWARKLRREMDDNDGIEKVGEGLVVQSS